MKSNNTTKGIICIILSAFSFSIMAFFVRLSGDLPTMQKAFFRNFIAFLVALFMLQKNHEKIYVPRNQWTDLFLRCTFGTIGLIANFYAVDHLNLADANILNKLSPFFVILASIPILKEKPSRFDLLTVLLAFIGAIFIVRPTGNFTLFPAFIGLLGGCGAGIAYTFVRKLTNNGVKTPVIVLAFSLFSCLVTLPFMILDFHPMSIQQIIVLLGAGLAAAAGQFAITTAYKFAPAKDISVYDYTSVLFSALWGFLFFAELPPVSSLIGYFIIFAVAVLRFEYAKHAK
jgi:drug/metabolite transporter (DMT)-like permease